MQWHWIDVGAIAWYQISRFPVMWSSNEAKIEKCNAYDVIYFPWKLQMRIFYKIDLRSPSIPLEDIIHNHHHQFISSFSPGADPIRGDIFQWPEWIVPDHLSGFPAGGQLHGGHWPHDGGHLGVAVARWLQGLVVGTYRWDFSFSVATQFVGVDIDEGGTTSKPSERRLFPRLLWGGSHEILHHISGHYSGVTVQSGSGYPFVLPLSVNITFLYLFRYYWAKYFGTSQDDTSYCFAQWPQFLILRSSTEGDDFIKPYSMSVYSSLGLHVMPYSNQFAERKGLAPLASGAGLGQDLKLHLGWGFAAHTP